MAAILAIQSTIIDLSPFPHRSPCPHGPFVGLSWDGLFVVGWLGLGLDLRVWARSVRSLVGGDTYRVRGIGGVGSGDPTAGFRKGVEGDGEDDDDSNNDLLDVGGDVHEHETVEQNADEDRADDRAEDRADAAE